MSIICNYVFVLLLFPFFNYNCSSITHWQRTGSTNKTSYIQDNYTLTRQITSFFKCKSNVFFSYLLVFLHTKTCFEVKWGEVKSRKLLWILNEFEYSFRRFCKNLFRGKNHFNRAWRHRFTPGKKHKRIKERISAGVKICHISSKSDRNWYINLGELKQNEEKRNEEIEFSHSGVFLFVSFSILFLQQRKTFTINWYQNEKEELPNTKTVFFCVFMYMWKVLKENKEDFERKSCLNFQSYYIHI